jgi:lysophospholipase L1-like esterase
LKKTLAHDIMKKIKLAEDHKMGRFSDGSRVCFVGDSITHANHFVAHIVDYYRKNFPKSGIEFYNCGISGGRLGTSLNSFDEDILPWKPTHAVLMIGINDSNRTLLNSQRADRYDALAGAFCQYKKNLELLAERFKDIGAELTLCTPAPYAEYIESSVEPLRGCSALMLGYSEYLKQFAKEKGYPLCDYHSYMTRLLSSSDEVLYGADRVHPTKDGHFYMAKCFLEFQGLELSEREISKDLDEWRKAVNSLRDTLATEHFLLNDDFTKSDEERMAAICAYRDDPVEGPHKDYFLSLARAYPENKKRQKENLAFVREFMKKQLD